MARMAPNGQQMSRKAPCEMEVAWELDRRKKPPRAKRVPGSQGGARLPRTSNSVESDEHEQPRGRRAAGREPNGQEVAFWVLN